MADFSLSDLTNKIPPIANTAAGSTIAGLALTQAQNLLGKTMGGYSSYGFSLNQSVVNALYSAGVNNGIPLIQQLFAQVADSGPTAQIGYAADSTELDIRHRISIFSLSQNTRIQCPIQKEIEISTGSSWAPLIPASLMEGLAPLNLVTIPLAGVAVNQKFFSRRIWTGSDPIKLNLPMRFVAVNDAFQDVVVPVRQLMKMALPHRSGWRTPPVEFSKDIAGVKVAGKIPSISLLAPPGPDPFPELQIEGFKHAGDRIDIYFGMIACFRNVILSNVAATFDQRVDANGKPISAQVELKFETYEMFTAEDINLAFQATEDTGAGVDLHN